MEKESCEGIPRSGAAPGPASPAADAEPETLELAEILDVAAVQALMEDFHELSRIPVSIVDHRGTVLVGVGWQEVCVRFHRRHPESCRHCRESDLELSQSVPEGECRLYKCKNNMWDIATPLVVGGQRVGHIFSGQFFFDDEQVDLEVFRAQARSYDFNPQQYLAAIEAVPRLSRQVVGRGMAFLTKLGRMLSQLSYTNIKLSRSLAQRDALMDSIRRSEQRLRTLGDQLPGGAIYQYLRRPDGTVQYRYVSAGVEGLSGLTAEQVLADPQAFRRMVVADDLPRMLAAEERSARELTPFDCEVRHHTLSGEMKWVHCRAMPRRDDGEGVVWDGVAVDVTQRKQAEEKLRGQRELLTAILEHIPVMLCIWDPSLEQFRFNRHLREVLGWTEADAGNDFMVRVYPDPEYRRQVTEYMQSHAAGWRDLQSTAKDGTPVDCSWANVRLSDDTSIGIGIDIRPRKRMERALRDSEEHARRIIDHMLSFVGVMLPDGTLVEANATAVAAGGLSRDEVLGRKFWDCPWWNYDPAVQRQLRDAVHRAAQGEVVRYDVVVRMAGDSRMPIDFMLAPVRNAAGRITHLIPSGVDITNRKRVEEQLTAAKAAAEHANQAKSQFLANMSHEIRTPMTAVLGFTELLQGESSPDEQREYLEIVQHSAKGLLQLIDDILDLSKIEAGKVTVESLPCSPQQILDEVIALMQVRAKAKNVALQAVYRAPIPSVIHTDPTRLRQILVNLLGNALKFTERGEVRAEVSRTRHADRSRLEFSIADTGIGIPAEQVAHIFEPFHQTDASTTRRFGGTGLGLAICRHLARALGGDITVISQVGRGSTFVLSIDAGNVAEEEVRLSPPAPQAVAPEPSRLAGRVLLVEDAQANRFLVSTLLRKFGLEVDARDNGQEALEQVVAASAQGQPYDLILMDMQMPGLDGFEATRRLRASGWSRPIIALTALAMTGDREKCLEAGCDDYLSKPVIRKELFAMLARYLG